MEFRLTVEVSATVSELMQHGQKGKLPERDLRAFAVEILIGEIEDALRAGSHPSNGAVEVAIKSVKAQ